MIATSYYFPPTRTEPMYAGQWWLPGLGTNSISDATKRWTRMMQEGWLVLPVNETTMQFVEWWRSIDPATFLVAVPGEVIAEIRVPKALYDFWTANPAATLVDVPRKLLGYESWLFKAAIVGLIGYLGYNVWEDIKRERAARAYVKMMEEAEGRR